MKSARRTPFPVQAPCQRRGTGPDAAGAAAAVDLLGPPHPGPAPVLPPGNGPRRLTTTWATSWLAVLLLAALAVNRPAAAGPGASWPDAAGVVAAYLRLARWVQTLDPPDPTDPAAQLPIDRATGACVILRQRGRVLGVGEDTTGDDLMVRRAVGRAVSAALGHRTVAGLARADRDRLGRALAIELEVAGRLEPLPGRSLVEVAEQIEPGLEGLALRRGDALRLLFPSRLRVTNSSAHLTGHLTGLGAELGLPAAVLADLAAAPQVRAYRFQTIDLVQRGPGRAPVQSFRGDTTVELRDVTGASITRFAAALVNHLITSLWPGDAPLGVMGDYRPVADDYHPLVAPPRDQALVAFALARFAVAVGDDPDEAQRAGSASRAVLADLADRAEGEDDPLADPVACATVVYAVSAQPRPPAAPAIATLYDRAARMVAGAAAAPEEGRADRGKSGHRPGPHGRALEAGALARMLLVRPGSVDPAAVRAALDRAWASVPEHQRVALLPWIGWAEADYARATGREPANTTALRSMRALLNSSRVGALTSPGLPDLFGGFDLTGRRGRQATAQTARPAAWLASALRDRALTGEEELPVELDLHLRTMRFLMQLAVRDSMLWAFRGPQRVLGGVRASAWDSNEPAPAQAMALLAAAETLLSLRSPPPDPTPPGPAPGAGG